MNLSKLSAFAFVVIVALVGCGSTTTHTVSGTVKFDGESIAEGHIAFDPIEEGSKGGSGPITNGSYKVQVPSGKMKVQINASKKMKLPAGEVGMYGDAEEVRSYIPDKYNSNTTLEAAITGPDSALNFDLKSK